MTRSELIAGLSLGKACRAIIGLQKVQVRQVTLSKLGDRLIRIVRHVMGAVKSND